MQSVGSVFRGLAKSMDILGRTLEVSPYIEKLIPSTRIVKYKNKLPVIGSSAFIAPSASVQGNVEIGMGTSVWYGATVRGDVNNIKIGEQSSIGENSVIHAAKLGNDLPTNIGSRCVIGSHAVVHAATVEDDSMIESGAQVLDGSKVSKSSILEANSVLTPGTTIPSGQLWSGIPAKFVRNLSPEEISSITEAAYDSFEMAGVHAEECSKDYRTVEEDQLDYVDTKQRSDDYFQKKPKGEVKDPADVLDMGVPGRIFNHPLTAPLPEEMMDHTKNETKK